MPDIQHGELSLLKEAAERDIPDADLMGWAVAWIETYTKALRFIRDLAQEELPYTTVGTGAEVVLRNIVRKVDSVLINCP